MLIRRILARFGKGLRTIVRSGLTPRELALTVCLGGGVGVLPLPWGTSLLCALLAARLRLNQAVIQGVNYLVYPVQIACYLPFLRLGTRWLPCGPAVSADALIAALHGPFYRAFTIAAWGTAKAFAAWLVTVPPLCLLCYPLILGIFRRRALLPKSDPTFTPSP